MDLLIGTHNQGKLREYQTLLADASVRVLGLDDVGLDTLDVDETGTTFEENARQKALAYAQASGLLALADDTGLVVDALDGRPGLHSARYGPPGLDDRGRRQHLLVEMEPVPDERRSAHFACVIVIADPSGGETYAASGSCAGHIARQDDTDGEHGFGYDAIFVPDGYDKPWSRVTKAEKNSISHRGKAARKLIPVLKQLAEKA
jgi:XTP/dITP diphosphohydrolase